MQAASQNFPLSFSNEGKKTNPRGLQYFFDEDLHGSGGHRLPAAPRHLRHPRLALTDPGAKAVPGRKRGKAYGQFFFKMEVQ